MASVVNAGGYCETIHLPPVQVGQRHRPGPEHLRQVQEGTKEEIMADFKCQKCGKKMSEALLDFRQRVATCKTCAPEYPEERIVGPWLTAAGIPVTISTRLE